MNPDCPGCFDEGTLVPSTDPVDPASPDYVTGTLLLVGGVVVFLLVDFFILHGVFHKPTTSQSTQHWSQQSGWFAAAIVAAFGVLVWHLVKGF